MESTNKIERRTLTEDENNDLTELKQNMGLLLVALREAKLITAPAQQAKKPGQQPKPPSSNENLNLVVKDAIVAAQEETVQELAPETEQVQRKDVAVNRISTQPEERAQHGVAEEDQIRLRTRGSAGEREVIAEAEG